VAATKRTVAFNPTDSPVVLDAEGHTLGGGEWAEVDPTSDLVSVLVEQGRLLFPADEKVSSAPSAPAATTTKE
jgi:hypothetical protein